jgi:hypothetical protein
MYGAGVTTEASSFLIEFDREAVFPCIISPDLSSGKAGHDCCRRANFGNRAFGRAICAWSSGGGLRGGDPLINFISSVFRCLAVFVTGRTPLVALLEQVV